MVLRLYMIALVNISICKTFDGNITTSASSTMCRKHLLRLTWCFDMTVNAMSIGHHCSAGQTGGLPLLHPLVTTMVLHVNYPPTICQMRKMDLHTCIFILRQHDPILRQFPALVLSSFFAADALFEHCLNFGMPLKSTEITSVKKIRVFRVCLRAPFLPPFFPHFPPSFAPSPVHSPTTSPLFTSPFIPPLFHSRKTPI